MKTLGWRFKLRLHLTNVTGTGATQLLLSLLPAIESEASVLVERVELPSKGKLSGYRSLGVHTVCQVYSRSLPNFLSRILECTLFASKFDGDTPLLVLGDMPLRCRGRQTVFVQTPHLIGGKAKWRIRYLKYVLARALFRLNLSYVRSFIVQTDVMRLELERSYPAATGRVYVIPQPVPAWLLKSGLNRQGRHIGRENKSLSLIYPAADYPHKNHALLSRIDQDVEWPVESLLITLTGKLNPSPQLAWVNCSGLQSSDQMIEAYSKVDALLFLSKEESYGFPLVEAMFVGLPIICPDRPYAHILCGKQAIYFDPDSPNSLLHAVTNLKKKLDEGWWPDWQEQLKDIPKDWQTVARKMIEVAVG